jgi:hypothetical protein
MFAIAFDLVVADTLQRHPMLNNAKSDDEALLCSILSALF